MGAKLSTFYDRVDTDDILAYIIEFKRQHNGIAPSSREIMAALDISSTSVIHYHLGKLADDGRITYPLGRGASRAIAVPGYSFTEDK